MGFYKDKEEMFRHRAEQSKKQGDRYYALYKQAEEIGDKEETEKNLKLSQKCYQSQKENLEKAEQYKVQSF
ncbi:hypothetical protein [Brachyspira hampsonii]|uniref:Uncharacterized protein n=2 Tax=Brachyspira hampsonii TaxID=1287055 RepID=A0AAC9TVY0_9SPIR|nr:hypothetical protein [Brachyspira hampsonii]ASJ21894.1 hypothetical protein BHAMNSH16_09690 [Brachyspira hampsonii]ELV05607.1 hypothetical protein H263_09213 [Brachyspira hampsonii 30599]MBW5379795.1 hypothetical protein [Brachyspira hampsonii]MBW5408801.1 hypothetical protein [Brachyspira hampsonii]OEJ15637.1 hypothetical protein A9496_13650 [Brachyspira hampsonii]